MLACLAVVNTKGGLSAVVPRLWCGTKADAGLMNINSKDDNKNKRGDLLRFIIALGAAALVAAAIGVYFVYRLFETQPSGSQMDLSRVLQEKLKVQEALVSPNTARIFFTTEGRHLSAEFIQLSGELTPYERITRLLDRLTRGPVSKYFEPVLPEKTTLRGVYVVDDEAILDFSRDLEKNFQGGIVSEMLTVYSIVNTVILNVEGVRRVQILIEGEVKASLAGEMDISAPLGVNLNLIRW